MTLPNVLSISRIPLGLAVLLFALNHQWGWAFVLLLIGCATDVLDGIVAKAMGNGTDFGADVLEPVCDLILTAGALAGVLLAGKLSWSVIIIVALVAGIVQVINSFFTKTVLFTHFGQWFMPCFFLGMILWMLLLYADLSLSSFSFTAFTVLTAIASLGLVVLKRHRFKTWFTPGALSGT